MVCHYRSTLHLVHDKHSSSTLRYILVGSRGARGWGQGTCTDNYLVLVLYSRAWQRTVNVDRLPPCGRTSISEVVAGGLEVIREQVCYDVRNEDVVGL